jgi:hypothetical protein
MHIRCLIASATVAFACLASSRSAEAAIELSPSLQINAIFSNPQGGFLMLLPASNPACGPSGNQFNVFVGQLSVTADGAKGALATALMAYAMNIPIRVYFDPALPGCPVQQVIIGLT